MAGSTTYAEQEQAMMDCNQLRQHLLEGGDTTEPSAVAHLDSCEPCAELAAADAGLARGLAAVPGVDPASLSELASAVGADIDAESGWRNALRSASTPARCALAIALLAAMALATVAIMPRDDLAVYPLARMLSVLGAFAATGSGVAMFSLYPIHRPPMNDAFERLLLLSALALPLPLAVLPQAHEMLSSLIPEGMFIAKTGVCFAFGSVVALAYLGGLRMLDRHRRITGRFATIAMGAAGLVANLALQLHCPLTSPDHLLLGHATVGVAWAALAAAAFRLVRR